MWLIMALSIAVGQFNIGTGAAGTTVTITPGFETKALILWWSGRTATNSHARESHIRGMGFATATQFRAWCTHDVNAAGTADCDQAQRTDACILEMSNTALVGWADVQSINSTQVVFEILDAFVTNMVINYIALGGSDITGAEVANFTPAGIAPTNQTHSLLDSGLLGKLVFFGGCRTTSADARADHSSSFFGAATSSSNEYVWAGFAQNGATSGNTKSYCRSAECITTLDITTDVCTMRGEFVSFATGQFTVNWLERSTSFPVHYLILSGTFQVALGDIQTLTTTGDVIETGLSFQPSGMMLVSANRAESSADVATVHDELSLGAATASDNEVCMGSSSRDGNTAMFVFTEAAINRCYHNNDVTAATATQEGAADFTEFTSDGFTLSMSDGDPSASFAWYVALASAPVVVTIPGVPGELGPRFHRARPVAYQ